jgi:hypothetical protein
VLPEEFTFAGSIELTGTKHLTTKTYMNDTFFAASSCGLCANYSPQGRRGGNCRQLNALVESKWESCSLFVNPFTLKKHIIEEAAQRLEAATQIVDRS